MTKWARAAVTDQVRTAVRFPMQLTLVIETAEGPLEAVTENISANGILFAAVRLPPVNSRVEFRIAMPAAVMGTPDDVQIECVGRIVRHQKLNGTLQAAAIIDEYVLRS